MQIKDEPDWDASSIEEEERSIAEMFQAEMSVKSEPLDEMDIEEESLVSVIYLFYKDCVWDDARFSSQKCSILCWDVK